MYDGQWVNNLPNGVGTMRYPNNDRVRCDCFLNSYLCHINRLFTLSTRENGLMEDGKDMARSTMHAGIILKARGLPIFLKELENLLSLLVLFMSVTSVR